jgi:hypothetical protein
MSTSIIFVDRCVADYQSIIDTCLQAIEVYVLDAESDGITQMLTRLSGRADIDVVHVISHGSSGALFLGNLPDGHFKFPHLWPVKFPQAGRPNYQLFGMPGFGFLSW